MIIKSLEVMEEIVDKNRDLKWDGWTVIHFYKSEKARTSKLGAFINGDWHMQNRYEPSANGWDIPKRFMEKRGRS